MKRIDKIWTTSKRKQSFYTCTCINSSSLIRGFFFLHLLQTLFLKKWKYPFIKVICHPRNSIYIATHLHFFFKMSLSYKHIKIVTQLKISIQKSNNKHIFVVKFKHMDITYFNNLKKKNIRTVHSLKKTTKSTNAMIHVENMDFKVFLQYSGKKR